MTRQQATLHAKRKAKRLAAVVYVVRDPVHAAEFGRGQGYEAATEEDMDTYYAGLSDSHIVLVASPDGLVHFTPH